MESWNIVKESSGSIFGQGLWTDIIIISIAVALVSWLVFYPIARMSDKNTVEKLNAENDNGENIKPGGKPVVIATTAISLIFALFASMITGAISATLDTRASHNFQHRMYQSLIEKGLTEQLNRSDYMLNGTIVAEFNGDTQNTVQVEMSDDVDKVSYIADETFAIKAEEFESYNDFKDYVVDNEYTVENDNSTKVNNTFYLHSEKGTCYADTVDLQETGFYVLKSDCKDILIQQ